MGVFQVKISSGVYPNLSSLVKKKMTDAIYFRKIPLSLLLSYGRKEAEGYVRVRKSYSIFTFLQVFRLATEAWDI
jgi:hypothetical protein